MCGFNAPLKRRTQNLCPFMSVARLHRRCELGVVWRSPSRLSRAVFIDHRGMAADEGDRSGTCTCWRFMASRRKSVPASCGVLLEPTSALLCRNAGLPGGDRRDPDKRGTQIDETTPRYRR